MQMDVVYQCTSYRELYASGGYYYIIQAVELDNNTTYIMVLNDGCNFNKLEKFRGGAPASRFSFKKTTVDSVYNSTNVIIVI